jgi:ABC-type uncharacterized transport system substrate-binding protein
MTKLIFLAAAALAASCALAQAHPHIWVKAKSEIVTAPDGTITGIKQAWTFDDMYSVNAAQGLGKNGVVSREDLADLSKTNVESLKDFDYFTYARTETHKQRFGDPVDYWSEYKNDIMTLYFTLPFKTPVKAKTLTIEVYDPTYLVDFSFVDHEPAKIVGAPTPCKVALAKPDPNSTTSQSLLSQMFKSGDATNMGTVYASKLVVTCP